MRRWLLPLALLLLAPACGASRPQPLMGNTRAGEIDACKQQALRADPKIWGALGIDIRVGADGRPIEIEPRMMRGTLTREYRDCVLRALWQETYRKSDGQELWFGVYYRIDRPAGEITADAASEVAAQ